MSSMPVHHAVLFGDLNLDQACAARSTAAGTGVRSIHRAMGSADQPLAGIVKKAVGLEIEFHRHVVATIQVRVDLALETDGKGAAGLATMDHVERDGLAALLKVGCIT